MSGITPDRPAADTPAVRSLGVDGLFVESSGDGAAVVLVHAGVADARMWDPQWAAWRPAYRLVRLDLRGHGRSAPPTGPFAHAEDVLRVLDVLGLEQAVLVGASFGGLVALDLAVSHPGRVRGLVLAGVPLPGHDWSAELEAFDLAESQALAAGDLDTAVALNLDLWLPGAPATVRSAIAVQQRRAFELQIDATGKHHLLVTDLAARIPTLRIPALVVDGELDVPDFRAIAERLGQDLPLAERATIAEAHHLPSLECPEAFDRAVRPFLDRVTARATR